MTVPTIRKSKYLFPWRRANSFELLVDGKAYFPRMLETIQRAQRYVLLEIYLVESGTVANLFIDALIAARGRGVQINLLLDAFGAAKLRAEDRQRLCAAGVELELYNPLRLRKWLGNMFRDHRKLLIVDGEVAFVSGTGITDDFDNPQEPARSWRETTLQIRGPVLMDWQELFVRSWNRQAHKKLSLPAPIPRLEPQDMRGRVATASALYIQDIRRSLFSRIRNATQRIWMCTAYFVPSRKLLRALGQAAQQGVDVRLLVPGPISDHPAVRHAGRRFYSRLMRHGVRIFEYQPRFMHAKTLLCDEWVSIGSSNFDRWNLRWNREANQEVNDARFAVVVHHMLENDLAHSIEIDKERWRRRRWITRLRERLWGRVDLWLDDISRRRIRRKL